MSLAHRPVLTKPRSPAAEPVFLTAFSSAAVMLAGVLLVLYCFFVDIPGQLPDDSAQGCSGASVPNAGQGRVPIA